MPKVSVLMSVYNDARDLPQAIDSILEQTFTDFEFVIVNDGSTDDSPSILNSYAQRDPRIVIIHNEQNIGLTRSLNRGLENVQGEFVARLDSNDLAVPYRLERQLAYMHAHPEIGLLSGNWRSMDEDGVLVEGERSIYYEPATHYALAWGLLWTNPIAHITVMIRRDVLTRHNIRYQPEYNGAEDYELWGTLSRVTKLIRLNEIYAHRRVIYSGISFAAPEKQLRKMYEVVRREVRTLLGHAVPESALHTMFDLVHLPENPHQDFRGMVDVLLAAYHHYRKLPLSPTEKRTIQGEAVGYLLRAARRAESRSSALYALWRLREVSQKEFYSRNSVQNISKTIFLKRSFEL